MTEIVDLSKRRQPVTYTVTITHHWDDTLEVFVADVADDERSRASVADALHRASQMFGPLAPAQPAPQGVVHEEQNTEQRKVFWNWLPLAYRDGHLGEEPKFTKYNMEVAHYAGWCAALTSKPVDDSLAADPAVKEWNAAIRAAAKKAHRVYGPSVVDLRDILALLKNEKQGDIS